MKRGLFAFGGHFTLRQSIHVSVPCYFSLYYKKRFLSLNDCELQETEGLSQLPQLQHFFSVTSITMHNIFTHTHKHTHNHDDIMAGIRIPSIWFSSLDQHSLLARNKRIGQVMMLETKLIQIRLSTRRKNIRRLQGIIWQLGSETQLSLEDGQLRTEKKTQITTTQHPGILIPSTPLSLRKMTLLVIFLVKPNSLSCSAIFLFLPANSQHLYHTDQALKAVRNELNEWLIIAMFCFTINPHGHQSHHTSALCIDTLLHMYLYIQRHICL